MYAASMSVLVVMCTVSMLFLRRLLTYTVASMVLVLHVLATVYVVAAGVIAYNRTTSMHGYGYSSIVDVL